MAEEAKETHKWPPLESNPEIFNEYLAKIGADTSWGYAEIFGLDEELLMMVPQPAVAVVAAIDRVNKDDGKPGAGCDSTVVPFYMKQTGDLDNACGIIAMIHAALNNLDQMTIPSGSILDRFIDGTRDITPDERSEFLQGFNDFKVAHQESASQGSSEVPDVGKTEYHFIAFVRGPNGELVECDGTKDGPSVIAESCDDVLKGAVNEIRRRLEGGFISERLNLMALCKQQ